MILSYDLLTYLLTAGAFRTKMNLGRVKLYSTLVPPADAELAGAAGDLLHTITGNGDGSTGLELAAAATNNFLGKDNVQVWGGENSSASGTPTYFRYAADGEDFEAAATGSPPRYRIQGSVGKIGVGIFDMSLQSIDLVSGNPMDAIPFFRFALFPANNYVSFSTGLVQHVLTTGSLRSAINATGVISYYSGSPPLKADAAIDSSNIELARFTVSNDGNTLLGFDSVLTANYRLQKLAAESWEATGLADGQATFYRWHLPSDAGGLSTTDLRMQGTISGSPGFGAIIINDRNIVSGSALTISAYNVGIRRAT